MEKGTKLTKKMPQKTRFAVYLIYICILAATIEFIYIDLISNKNLIIVPSILLFISQIFIIGFLGFKIGQGKNWARITLLALLVIGIITDSISIFLDLSTNVQTKNAIGLIKPSVMLLAELLIIYMLFNRESNKWFKEGKTITKPKNIFAQNQLKLLTVIGLVCLLIPLLIFGLWIYASNMGATQPKTVDIFHNYFPDFLRGRYDLAILSIIFAVIAIILSGICLKINGRFWKVLNVVILALGCLLLFLNLFSMM